MSESLHVSDMIYQKMELRAWNFDSAFSVVVG